MLQHTGYDMIKVKPEFFRQSVREKNWTKQQILPTRNFTNFIEPQCILIIDREENVYQCVKSVLDTL